MRERAGALIGGRVDVHLGKTVLLATAAVGACLLTVVTLFTAMDEVRDATPGYSAGHALLYLLHSTPRRIYDLTPYAVFVGVLTGLGALARDGEITVLRAAGMSTVRLFAAAGAPVLLVLLANMALGEFVAPAADARAAAVKQRTERGGGYMAANSWHRQGSMVTNIAGFDPQGRLVDVRQYVVDDGRLRLSRRAATGALGADQGHWLLRRVAQTRINDAGTRAQRLAEVPWRSAAAPTMFTTAAVDPVKLSLVDLRARIRHLRAEALDAAGYQVAFWAKVFQPLAVLGLVWLAVGFVIGPLREVGMGTRLCVGIVVGLAFKYLADVFGPMSIVFAIPPAVAMFAPVAICWLAGAWMIRRV